jgi:lipopolysaccharide/colanic/teichoic acid biosynthesis glycosyltransferase
MASSLSLPLPRSRSALAAKRSLDLLLLVPALLLALPIIAIAALAIVAVSRGTPFYGQLREGQGGRPITIWKLRTMHLDAEALLERHLDADAAARAEWQTKYKLSQDPRILPVVGTLLRRTSLDELPQLWNIARGEMSFVGPRPFPAYHLAAFDDDFLALRRSVVPGLTGLWQVSLRSEADLAAQRELDRRYVEGWSLWLDLGLLARTPFAVVRGRGAM